MKTASEQVELVLLAANRARGLASGSAITVDWENDEEGVVALREIAEKTKRLVHSMQEYAEIDEPEAATAPMQPRESRPTLGRDDPIDTIADTMTEDALLRGLERLVPEGPSKQI